MAVSCGGRKHSRRKSNNAQIDLEEEMAVTIEIAMRVPFKNQKLGRKNIGKR